MMILVSPDRPISLSDAEREILAQGYPIPFDWSAYPADRTPIPEAVGGILSYPGLAVCAREDLLRILRACGPRDWVRLYLDMGPGLQTRAWHAPALLAALDATSTP